MKSNQSKLGTASENLYLKGCTGCSSSSCEMIIFRNKHYGINVRVFMAIFNINIYHLPQTPIPSPPPLHAQATEWDLCSFRAHKTKATQLQHKTMSIMIWSFTVLHFLMQWIHFLPGAIHKVCPDQCRLLTGSTDGISKDTHIRLHVSRLEHRTISFRNWLH